MNLPVPFPARFHTPRSQVRRPLPHNTRVMESISNVAIIIMRTVGITISAGVEVHIVGAVDKAHDVGPKTIPIDLSLLQDSQLENHTQHLYPNILTQSH